MSKSLMQVALATYLMVGWAGTTYAEQWKLGVKIVAAQGGGVEVVEVFDSSPAEKIGLKAGAVIVAVNGNLISDPQKMKEQVFADKARTTIIYKDGADFYQADAEYAIVTVAAVVNGKQVQTKTVEVKDLKRKKVADPRKNK